MNIVMLGECMAEFHPQRLPLWRQSFAGDVFNTALYMKRLLPNADVAFASVTGQEPLSDAMRDYILKVGLNTRWLLTHPDYHCGLYFIHTDQRGERHFTYYRQQSAARTLMQVLSDADWQAMSQHADWLFLSAITLAILNDEERQQLLVRIQALKKQGVRLAFDSNYRSPLWESREVARQWIYKVMGLCELVFAGTEDIAALTDSAESDSSQVADELNHLSIPELVIKAGEEDVKVITERKCRSFAVQPVLSVVDTTAAGDSFNAGYLASMLAGGNINQRADNGRQLAATVIQHSGAIIAEELTPTLVLND